MGTWDSGNFDSDAASDMRDEVMKVIDVELDGFTKSDRVGVEDLDDIVACIAMKLALIERCNATRPEPDEAEALRDKVLDIYDRCIDSLKPMKGFKEKRRKVIVRTLDAYVRAAIDE